MVITYSWVKSYQYILGLHKLENTKVSIKVLVSIAWNLSHGNGTYIFTFKNILKWMLNIHLVPQCYYILIG
jgi:hypothetical protein